MNLREMPPPLPVRQGMMPGHTIESPDMIMVNRAHERGRHRRTGDMGHPQAYHAFTQRSLLPL